MQERTIQVLVLGEVVKVTYRPWRLTQVNWDAWVAQGSVPVQGSPRALLEMVETLISVWDLGVPLTREALRDVPDSILQLILEDIIADRQKLGPTPAFTFPVA